ncbi:hypothetical protein DCAR_0934942 [Daucus carota subsp. sativus]|uniref:Glycosyltransferase n=1 Tax=Daucus carota subsp. sativus TaxID=79200 RepID=A0A175YH45_DAUCS|nr:PREDICTED: UDP-glycosyltransferase 89A2-like [Daucus carota subsp. sativus]WOH15404.1 hypothetical protein DCAR_0934942 [Daucus carota subsp. sativus]
MSTLPGKGVHILVFPFPAQGHMLPLLDLTHQLLLRGLTITLLVTPKNLPILDPLLSIHPSSSLKTLVLPFPDHPLVPSGVENVKDIGNAGNVLIISALAKLSEEIIQWIRSHPSPPVAVLFDSFLGWTNQLGLPRICFHSTAAIMSSVFDALWQNLDALFPLDAVEFPDLPRSPSLIREHLPSLFRRYIKSDPNWELVKDSMAANSSSWGYVNNTFEALEPEFLEFLRNKLGHNRIFAVGPLSLLGGSDSTSRGSTSSSSVSHDDIWSWLNGCADGSVLYVCFGSQVLLRTAQVEALANGLERSGVKFIWVMKPATAQQVADGFGSIPYGFEARVKGRGLIIQGWAPQVPILSHRAVGGFVSHCGWNSLLEGIVGGTMILGWPMEADQFVNAKLLVDYMGVAVRLCEGKDTVPDPIKLGQKVAESMSGEIAEKVRAKELRSKAMEAVGGGGSSSRDLDRLVRELTQLQSV